MRYEELKCAILIGDGMADLPVEELDGKTPLDVAEKPRIDSLCRRGILGRTNNIPDGYEPGSDVAIMSIMGYEPEVYFTGRGPLEAASVGVEVKSGQFCFRCNLIHADGDRLADYSAGHITTEEGRDLIAYVEEKLGGEGVHFYPGVQYRHLLVMDGDFSGVACHAPHDHMDQPWRDWTPSGAGAERLRELIEASQKLLPGHPVNAQRARAGKATANSLWPWSGGGASEMRPFKERYGATGSVISAVDLVQGLGSLMGLEVIRVKGATGLVDTNYEGKVEAALDSLDRHDLTIVHLEGIDEGGHMGDLALKLEGIRRFDERVVGPVEDWMAAHCAHYRIVVLPDHATSLKTRTHVAGAVPFAFYDNRKPGDCGMDYNEKNSKNPAVAFKSGAKMMAWLLGKN